MIDSTLALMTRSLRSEARLVRHHLFRALFISIIYFSVLFAHSMSFVIGAPGLWLFQSISWLNLIFITLAGLGFFASVITEEKEEETLGLLKMAGMRPLSLLLGKSTSRLLTVGLLLSLQFPFTLLAITLGGVTLEQILAVYLALLAYTALVANLALFWSVYARRSGTAAAAVFLLLALFFVVPPIASALSQAALSGYAADWERMTAKVVLPVADWLCSASIIMELSTILATGFGKTPFSIQVVSNFGAALGLFVLSWLTFEHFTRDHVATAAVQTSPFKRPGLLKWLRAGRTWSQALVWKDFHYVSGGLSAGLAKMILYGVVMGLFAFVPLYWTNRIDWDEVGGLTMIFMMIFAGVELSLHASRIFHVETRWATWAPLMMLPLSRLRIVASKIAGCLLGLIPAVIYFHLGAMLDMEDFLEAAVEWPVEPGFWLTLLIFVFFLHLTALLSLFVKWGALPLAIGIMFFGYMFLSMTIGIVFMLLMPRFGMSFFNENVVFLLIGSPFLAGCIGMEYWIGLRLRHLAAR